MSFFWDLNLKNPFKPLISLNLHRIYVNLCRYIDISVLKWVLAPNYPKIGQNDIWAKCHFLGF